MEKCSICFKPFPKLRTMRDGNKICQSCYLKEKNGKQYVKVTHNQKEKAEIIKTEPISKSDKKNIRLWAENIKLKRQSEMLKKSNAKAVQMLADLKCDYTMLESDHKEALKAIDEFVEAVQSDKISKLFELIKKYGQNNTKTKKMDKKA